MKMKELAKAVANCDERRFDQKVDKEIEKLLRLRLASKIITLVKKLHWQMMPKHLNETFKCTLEKLHTFPQSWGMVYSVGNEKGKLQLEDEDIDLLYRGLETITDNQLVELATKGLEVDHTFEEKLIYMFIGKNLSEEYFEHAFEIR